MFICVLYLVFALVMPLVALALLCVLWWARLTPARQAKTLHMLEVACAWYARSCRPTRAPGTLHNEHFSTAQGGAGGVSCLYHRGPEQRTADRRYAHV